MNDSLSSKNGNLAEDDGSRKRKQTLEADGSRPSEPHPPPRGDWFSQLFGFAETKYDIPPKWLRLEEEPGSDSAQMLKSLVTGDSYYVGTFETPTLGELRQRAKAVHLPGRLRVRNERGDVAQKHAAVENRHATFQVASQFNCLEFVGPRVVPEDGVTGYTGDRTQGPACSVACGPATVYRNYFAPVLGPRGEGGQPPALIRHGQVRDCQIDNLLDFSRVVGNIHSCFFNVCGGYTMADDGQLRELNKVLSSMGEDGLDAARAALRIGLHSDVQVTSYSWGRQQVRDPSQRVSQVFGSACAVAYNRSSSLNWESVATLILEASYEATLLSALLAAQRHNGEAASNCVFLTCLGGGVFGNDMHWITQAIRRACQRCRDYNLDVRIITYAGPIDRDLQDLEREFE